jgi:hypothetical protein
MAVAEDGAAHPRTLSLFPEDRCEGLLADASIVRVKLSGAAAVAGAAAGSILVQAARREP